MRGGRSAANASPSPGRITPMVASSVREGQMHSMRRTNNFRLNPSRESFYEACKQVAGSVHSWKQYQPQCRRYCAFAIDRQDPADSLGHASHRLSTRRRGHRERIVADSEISRILKCQKQTQILRLLLRMTARRSGGSCGGPGLLAVGNPHSTDGVRYEKED